MILEDHIQHMGEKARRASRALALLSTDEKNQALRGMADALVAASQELLNSNAQDLGAAEEHGLSPAALDRLRLTETRIVAMADGIRAVAELDDPVGTEIESWTRPNGIAISKVRSPIGVIGIIYESRPNVTSDAAVLCLKTSNAVILRGGSESLNSNLAIAAALQSGGLAAGLPEGALQLVPVADREAVRLMARLDKFIDLIVPRGGHALIEAVVSQARMPVIKHYHGVCHVYVDKDADLEMALRIAVNAKCQRPGVCNAMEALLVHKDVAENFLNQAAVAFGENGVGIHADERALNQLAALNYAPLRAAEEDDWSTEYLDLRLSLRVVDSMEEAISHIEKYGSHHSDAIVTRSKKSAERFLNEVDSATVYWNASTRFSDGAEFGFGAEIGISTDKLHARGPMGLKELTTYKYLIRGNGQIRE